MGAAGGFAGGGRGHFGAGAPAVASLAAMLMLLQSQISNPPPVHVPVVGSVWLIGALFLGHIIFGTLSMGIVVLAPTYELVGMVRGRPWMDRFANALSTTNIKVFSFGATLAAFAVTMMLPLWSNLFVRLWTLFWLPVLTAFLTWLVTITLLLIYVYRWNRMSASNKPAHVAVGYAAALSEHSFLFLIVGLDSYMLTPNGASSWAAIFNATFWEELVHRFIGDISWVSLLAAAVMVLYGAANRDEVQRGYYGLAARASLVVGFAALVPQAVSGFFFAEAIRSASPGAFRLSFTGGLAWLWLVQQFLFGVVLLAVNVYFLHSRPRPNRMGLALTVATTLLSALTVLPAAWYLGYFWVRYILLFGSLLLTGGHCLFWWRSRLATWAEPLLRRSSGRLLLTAGGVVALLLVLLMGTIRETARGPYTVYGVQTQQQGQSHFQPPRGYFP
ncbi:MAG: cytochrome ubiquinol oxidase subunit I [Candidatus Dormibacteraeota bacterium]|nr:cytochrome ubiquinol oxidase subunit I [Candidatus Dormibacteraeota bacterium]